MSDVVGMDGQPVKNRLSPEDVKALKIQQSEDDAESRRLQMLKMAVEIQNPSLVTAASTVVIAQQFYDFVKQKETKGEEGPQTNSLPSVAPGSV